MNEIKALIATPKERQGNIELLRILSMLMIITLHFLGHGGVLNKLTPFTPYYYFGYIMKGLCYVSVNCYVFISGYFLVDSKFKIKKLMILLAQVLFYSITIYLVLCGGGLIEFSVKDALLSLIPTMSNRYWFVTMYVGMYLLSPFLNIAVKAMTKKSHYIFIMVLFALFSLIPTFVFFSVGLNFGGDSGVVWFITLYIIAAYIKKYYTPARKKSQTRKLALGYFGAALLVPISQFCIVLLSKTGITHYVDADRLLSISILFYKYNSVLVLAASLLLFLLFLNIQIKGKYVNKLICFISLLTFGVYLFHDNPHLRSVLWNFIGADQYADGPFLLPFMVLVVLSIFTIGIMIDLLRKWLFKAFESSARFDHLCNALEAKLEGGILYTMDKIDRQ